MIPVIIESPFAGKTAIEHRKIKNWLVEENLF